VQIYSCCACSDSRGGATPHTPAAAAEAAAAAAAAADWHEFDSSFKLAPGGATRLCF